MKIYGKSLNYSSFEGIFSLELLYIIVLSGFKSMAENWFSLASLQGVNHSDSSEFWRGHSWLMRILLYMWSSRVHSYSCDPWVTEIGSLCLHSSGLRSCEKNVPCLCLDKENHGKLCILYWSPARLSQKSDLRYQLWTLSSYCMTSACWELVCMSVVWSSYTYCCACLSSAPSQAENSGEYSFPLYLFTSYALTWV